MYIRVDRPPGAAKQYISLTVAAIPISYDGFIREPPLIDSMDKPIIDHESLADCPYSFVPVSEHLTDSGTK